MNSSVIPHLLILMQNLMIKQILILKLFRLSAVIRSPCSIPAEKVHLKKYHTIFLQFLLLDDRQMSLKKMKGIRLKFQCEKSVFSMSLTFKEKKDYMNNQSC